MSIFVNNLRARLATGDLPESGKASANGMVGILELAYISLSSRHTTKDTPREQYKEAQMILRELRSLHTQLECIRCEFPELQCSSSTAIEQRLRRLRLCYELRAEEAKEMVDDSKHEETMSMTGLQIDESRSAIACKSTYS